MKIVDQLMAAAFGDRLKDGIAQSIASKYHLKNPHFLGNILSTLSAFKALHEDIPSSGHTKLSTLQQFRSEYSKLCRSAHRLRRLQKGTKLGGAVMAISEYPTVFEAIQIVHCIAGLEHLGSAPIEEPVGSTLTGLIMPLVEYWHDCTGDVPKSEFAPMATGLEPTAGTACAFVVEALNATGWSFGNADVSAQLKRARLLFMASDNYRQAA